MSEANAGDAEQGKEEVIEYSVYVYHHPVNKKEGQNDWEMLDQTTNMDEAMKMAEGYQESGDYQKIEVKKKYFDEKNNRKIDMTLKVLENNPKQAIGFGLWVALAAAAGIGAFGLTMALSSFLK